MFRFRLSSLAAATGLLLVFNSCERHHVGEMPELQREHLHPLQASREESVHAYPRPEATGSPTPAEFFPKQQ
jgi:hypothetical protein